MSTMDRAMIAAPAALVATIFIASLVRVDAPIVIVEGRVLRPSVTATRTFAWLRTAMRERGESMVASRRVRLSADQETQELTTDEAGFALASWTSPPGGPAVRVSVDDLESGARLVEMSVPLLGEATNPGAIPGIELPAPLGKTRFVMGVATRSLVTNVPTRVTFWATPPLDPQGSLNVDDLSGLTVSEKRICADGRAELLVTAEFHTASLRMTASDRDGKELGTAFVAPDVARGAVEVNVPVVLPPGAERSLLTRIPSSREIAYAVLRDPSGVLFARQIRRDEPVRLPALDPGHYALSTTPELGAESDAELSYPIVVANSRNLCDTALDRIRPDGPPEAPLGDTPFRGTSEGKVGRDVRKIRRTLVWGAYALTLGIELVGFGLLMRRKVPTFSGAAKSWRVPAIGAMMLAFGLLAAFISWRF